MPSNNFIHKFLLRRHRFACTAAGVTTLVFLTFLAGWYGSKPDPISFHTKSGIAAIHSEHIKQNVLGVPDSNGEQDVPDEQDLPPKNETDEDAAGDSDLQKVSSFRVFNFVSAGSNIHLLRLTQAFNAWSTLPLFVLHHSWKSFLR